MFELNGSTLVGIGAVLGALCGAVSFLFKALIEAKDSQLSDVTNDRDFWRDVAMGRAKANERADWQEQRDAESRPAPTPRRRSSQT